MIITIKDIEKSLKDILDDSSVQSSNSTYEKIDDGYRLIIDIKNLFYDKSNIIYTKMIFYVDDNKIYLLPNKDGDFQFRYLFDINCNYKLHIFENVDNFKNILLDILKNKKFGNNIRILSEFIKSPCTLINNWFSENGVRNISVYDVKLDERYKIIPCKNIFFNFNINLNNQIDINLTLRKEDKSNYIFNFKIYDNTIEEETQNLSTMIQTIGNTIKNKYV